jgi:hypothetical protein
VLAEGLENYPIRFGKREVHCSERGWLIDDHDIATQLLEHMAALGPAA